MFKKTFHLFHRHYHLKYKGVYRHAKKLFIFDLALLALALTILSAGIFLFFWKPSLTDLVDLKISLGDKRTKSGEYVHLTIDYLNRSKFKLESTTLSLQLPDGFIIDRAKTSKSLFDETSIFPAVKELPAGAKGQVEIYGWFWTTPNQEEKIVAKLLYKPENTDRREQKISHFLVRLPGSVLNGRLNIAASTFKNQKLNFTYIITNDSNEEVKNISLSHNWPTDIFDKKYQRFSLAANQTQTITGQLTAPSKSGSFSLAITPQILIGNRLITQSIIQKNIQIISPSLYSQAKFSPKISYLEPNGLVPIELKWENKSKFTLQNLRMRLIADQPQIIDWDKTAKENRIKLGKNEIIIDNQTRTKFSDGSPNNGDNFQIQLYLKSHFDYSSKVNQIYLQITPIMEADLGDTAGQKYSEFGNSDKLPLATEVTWQAETRYYTASGDQVGRGPLPPQVGETTKYWIFVHINNTTNPLTNTTLKTSLPWGVEPTGRDSVTIGPNIKYNKNTRLITWSYDNDLPANSYAGVYFEVQVTPTSQQVGQKIKLTDELFFSATDSFVNKKFNLKQDSLDNILPANDIGAGKGYKVSPAG